MDSPFYEYIVVGLGGIGSGTLYWLAKQAGNKVLGLEQFKLGHDHGGSQDHSRIIRHMYFDKRYTKLTRHTYEAWEKVENESGLKLVHKTGSLDVARNGTSGIETLQSYAKAMEDNNIHYQKWNGSELRQRFPQWTTDDNVTALYQPEGGLVDAALGNSVHIQLAQAHGATVKENCTVIKLEPKAGDQCVVHTNQGIYTCRRVILTCGAWVNNLLGSVGVNIPLVVTQEQVSYYATPNVKEFTKEKFPVYIFHTSEGFDFYGLPSHVNAGYKIGVDVGGPAVSPETRNYNPDPVREKLCEEFISKYHPKALGPLMYTKTCLYTLTLDRDFVVDTLASRGMPQVVLCVGAGHAFKFASFLGKVLGDLALRGQTEYDIREFTFSREAVHNPQYKPAFWRGDLSQAKL